MKAHSAAWPRLAASILFFGGLVPGLFGANYSVSYSVSPTSVAPDSTPSFSVTLTNNTSSPLSGVDVSVTLPDFLYFLQEAPSANCGSNLSPSISGDARTLTITGNLPAPSAASPNCTVSASLFAPFSGTYNIESGATLTVTGSTNPQPPSISKSFSPAPVTPNTVSTLTLFISSSSNDAFNLSFTDNLPSGLKIASPPNVSNSCGGSVTATGGGTSVALSGGNISNDNGGGFCSISVDTVTGTQGTYNNSVTLSSTLGTANTGTTSVVVGYPPSSVTKSFNPTTIAVGGTSTLSITITADSRGGLTNLNFDDYLPFDTQTGNYQLAIASPSNLTSTCGTNAASTPDSADLYLGNPNTGTGVTLAAGASCTVSVSVTATNVGTYANGPSNLFEVSADQGSASPSVDATLTVTQSAVPPTVTKSFSPSTIPLNGTSTLTITITNPNTSQITGVGFTDNFPSGMRIAASPNLSSNCTSGTTSGSAGATSLGLSGASIAGSGSCTVSVTVTGTTAGSLLNSTGAVSSSAGSGTAASATLTVIAPPSISKAFGGTTVGLGQTTSLTFTITNANTSTTLTGVGFVDTLPSGLTIASNTSTVCGGGTLTTSAPNGISLSGGSIAASNNCQFNVTVTATTAGVKNNVTGSVSSANGGTGNTASAGITVLSPPSISKGFGASTISVGGTTSLTFTITNPNPSTALSGVGFTDTLPSGLTVANGTATVCGGGTVTNTAPGTISLSSGSINANSNCQFSVTVTGATAGVQNNTTGAVSSTNGGTGATSNTATITVMAPPTVSKAFGASTVPLNGTVSLTFTITNPNAGTTLTGIAFVDTMPSGLTVPNGTTTACGGTVATTLPGTISLNGVSIAGGTTCQASVTITGATQGVWNNTTAAVSSTNGGTGTTSNTATITVVAPPTISKSFGAATIPVSGTTSLSFTISNPNSTQTLNGVGFTDSLPNGLTVVSGTSTTCGGGTLTTTAPGTIALSGGSVGSSSNCQITVTVTGTTAGVQNNTTGAVSSTNGGTGTVSNTATITVVGPPTISKAFGVATIPVGGTTSLSFTLTNPNSTVGLTGVSFTDTLPAGLSASGTAASSCGTVTVAAGSVSLSNGTIAASGSCNITGITVTGNVAGAQNNSVTVSSTNGGANNTPGTATVTVVAPPTISKAFGAATIPLNGTASLTFTITNPNTGTTLTGVAFTDAMPSGLTVASGTSTTCSGGTLTTTAPGTVSLSGGSIGASSNCQITVTVTGATAGVKNNTTGAVSSANGGTGTTSNTATITVVAPPSISKAFGAATIPLNGNTTLSFTITNPNSTVALTGVNFTDTLPSGLSGSGTATGSCGTVTVAAGSVSLSNGTIAASGSCSITGITVTGTTAGVQNNSVTVSSTNGGTGNAGTASVTVVAPPSITKSFSPNDLPPGGTSTVSFTITNPNSTVALTGVAFTDSLPAGMTVASSNNLSWNCGTATANPGASSISLTGGTVATGGTCTVSAKVTAPEGIYNNSVQVTSTNGGTGNTATATAAFATPSSLTKAFGEVSILPLGSTSLTFTLTNPNHTLGLNGLAFSDTLPAGLVISTPDGLTGSCGGGSIMAPAGGNLITLSSASLAAQTTCTFSVNVSSNGTVVGPVFNSTSSVTATAADGVDPTGNPATATLFIGEPFLVSYAANLNIGESYIDIGNAGTNGDPLQGPGLGAPAGNICVNVYTLDAGEELVSCCSCLVTPGQTVDLGVNADLTVNTQTGVKPTSVTVKLVTTLAGGDGTGTSCNNSAATAAAGGLASGTTAFRTTLHATPVSGSYATTEAPFTAATLSAGELASITGRCSGILGNGSGFGICTSCSSGAQAAGKL